jgi:UDP-4-amino-4,6-dideoxy-N-acetyl-beta-L-altrosamine transaminase
MKGLKKKIPYSRQNISEEDIECVNKVLRSEYLTNGPVVDEFEDTIKKKFNSKYATVVNSASSALHISCLAMGLGKNDTLWTVPNTFVATANCAIHCNASVDFVDIEEKTSLMCVEALKKKLKFAKKNNKLPKIIIPVHLGGQPTLQEEIYKLSLEYGFKIIEDASHSMGATRNGDLVGNCKWSHATVFSFHPVKIITSGEGGAVLSNDKEFDRKCKLFRSNGITRDRSFFHNKDKGPWYYEQQSIGFNYKLSDIHSALGLSQLNRLNKFIKERNRIADIYNTELKDLPIHLPKIINGNKSSYHLYIIRTIKEMTKYSHSELHNELINRGIKVNLHYYPVHLHPHYKSLGFKENMFPVSEKYAEQAISIPIFPGLTESQQSHVIEEISKLVN